MIGAFVLALMTAVTFGLPDSSFAGTQSNPTADDVQYYTVTKDGKEVKTGIKSIVIDPNTYTNINRDPDICIICIIATIYGDSASRNHRICSA